MANRKKSNRKTLRAPLSLQNMRRRSTHPTTQTGTMRNGNIGSRTCTGVRARHTRLRTATIIHLDGARPKDAWSRLRPRSRRLQQRLRSRARTILSNYLDQHQTAITVNITKNSKYSISSIALQIYGFVPNPSEPVRKNRNRLLVGRHPSQYFSSLSNMAFHNLCMNAKTPPGTEFLLGLGLKKK
jgi:hypothetical protein